MALSQRLVDRIFARLLVRYGAAWLRMWDGIEIEAVKADWAEQLSALEDKPHLIAYAVENLPADKPPTVAQFRALCGSAPPPVYKALPQPRLNPAKAREASEAVKAAFVPPTDRLAWAKRLRDAEAEGKPLTEQQRKDWRIALATMPDRELFAGISEIDPAVLPPAMRPAGY